jgi:hypothetical protein
VEESSEIEEITFEKQILSTTYLKIK